MPKVTPIITNFTAGELSPLLDGRIDIAAYYNGAKIIENFIPLPQGGLKRRPGTYYVATTKDSSRKSRLIPFQFSTTQAYNVEFGDRYCRFYANNGQILSGASAYEITTPYLEADLFSLQIAQDADTMWIVHPSYKPRKLQRGTAAFDSYVKLLLHCNGTDGSTTFTDEIGKTMTANGNVQIDTAQYKFGGAAALFDGNSDYISSAHSADWTFTGDFSIDFQIRFAALPTDGNNMVVIAQTTDVNNFWMLFISNSSGVYYLTFREVVTGSPTVTASQVVSISTNTWYHMELTRSGNSWYHFLDGQQQGTTITDTTTLTDFASGIEIGEQTAFGDRCFNGWLDELRVSKGVARHTANFTSPSVAYSPDTITFTLKNYAPEAMELDVAPGGAGWAAGDTITGQTSGETCEIVSVTDTKNYRVKDRSGTFTDGEVLTNGTDTADQGAGYPSFTGDPFGADSSDDCPSCVSIHEQRIFFAGSNNYPQKVWASVSGDYEDMTTGADDDDALDYTIGSEQVNAIRWLSSGRILGLGTLGGVFSLSSGSDELALTPSNVTVKRETSYGAIGIVPKKIGNYVYYVQRNSRTVREFGYSYDIDEYASFDQMLLAEHISEGGIVDMDYQQSPYNMLWCVRNDGQLICMTRQIDQKVLAWSRQILGGSYDNGDAVVESVSIIPGDGGDDEVWIIVKRTINSNTVRYVEYFKPFDWGTEQEDAFFVDSGLSLDNPKNITGISKADPGVVTVVGHGFSDEDTVIIRGVSGMTEVNRKKYKVANKTDDTFELTDTDDDDVDTSNYTTYVSGGEVRRCVTSLSGLDHLEKETIDLFIDGDDAITATVSSGGVTIPAAYKGGEIHAGLRFTPYLKTMRLEAGSQLGTAQSKLKRVSKVFVRLYESLKTKIGNVNTQDEFDFRPKSDSTTNPIEVFTGDQEVLMPSAWDRDGYVVVTQDGPYPLTITSLIIYFTVSDD